VDFPELSGFPCFDEHQLSRNFLVEIIEETTELKPHIFCDIEQKLFDFDQVLGIGRKSGYNSACLHVEMLQELSTQAVRLSDFAVCFIVFFASSAFSFRSLPKVGISSLMAFVQVGKSSGAIR
jgi:hypothetical protein